MPAEPLFDLELLGYRNDLARERVLALLRTLPETAALPAVARETSLPQRLPAGLPHAQGLQLVGVLRDHGAQVRLVAAADGAAAATAPPAARAADPPRARPSDAPRPLLGVLFLLFVGAAILYLLPLQKPRPPRGDGSRQALEAAGTAALTQRLNNDAVALNAAGQFGDAAERLREAVAEAPQEAALQRNLRVVLLNWGIAELNADRPDAAVPLLEEALAIEEDAMVLSALGIARVGQGQYAAGRDLLERAAARGAENPATLTALARACRQLGDRAAAVEALHRAREAGAGGAEFDALVTRLERELDAEWDFAETRSAHFTIGFAGGERDSNTAAELVARGLEDAYFHVGAQLDVYPDERIAVVLYASEDFHDVTQTPSWTAGVYDGRIKLPVGGLVASDHDVLERTLRHEYGHVLVHLLSRSRCPVWLNEGLAIAAEEQEPGDRTDWAHRTLAGEELFRLAELEGPFTALPAARVPVAYAQSYLAVRTLLDRHGARRMRELLANLGTGTPFADAFRNAFYRAPGAFDDELIDQLTR